MTDAECVALLQWAAPRLHLRFRGLRSVRRLPCKRIGRRLRELRLDGPAAYRAFLDEHPSEWASLDAICRIPISRFYRDHAVFEMLGHSVLPALARRALARGESALRCWSAGCASGEEVYTLSFVFRIVVAPAFSRLALHVIGTDIDPQLIERAHRACYPAGTLKELPTAWQEACFDRVGDLRCVRAPFRRGIRFAVEDIRRTMPEGPFDLILCRNLVFTYFDETLQREVGAQLAGRLAGGGAMVIGRHEALPEGLLAPWFPREGIFRQPEARLSVRPPAISQPSPLPPPSAQPIVPDAMRVREAMTRPAKTIRGEDTVRDAARHMRDLGVGALPVFEGKQLAGVITDRDITTRVTAEERNPAATPVADVMTRGALSCYEDQTVAEAAKMMVDEGVRRLVVVDRREEVVGVISVDDLAVLVSDEALAGAEILPAPPDP